MFKEVRKLEISADVTATILQDTGNGARVLAGYKQQVLQLLLKCEFAYAGLLQNYIPCELGTEEST